MVSKIVRLLLVVTVIFVMALQIPAFYRKWVEKRPMKTMIYYSEVNEEFLISQEIQDSLTGKSHMEYFDASGTRMTEAEFMRLLPFNYTRRLKLKGEMPDSLRGVKMTPLVTKGTRKGFLLEENTFKYRINPMFESETGFRGVSMPEDLFRFTSNGVEFFRSEDGSVETEKTREFNQALQEGGFIPPARDAFGIPSTIKRRDDGYFITDATGALFHLKMVEGHPYLRAIPFPSEVKNIKCYSSGDLLCHIFDTDSHLYALTCDYELRPIETEKTNGRFVLSSNCFYNTYKVSDNGKSTLYVFDDDYRFVASHTEDVDHYVRSKEAATERALFPFSIMQTPGYAHFIPLPNPVRDFYRTNLACLALFMCLLWFRRRKLTAWENIADAFIVLCTGIFGLLAVCLIPGHR